jgi:hypothetical protein
MRADAPSSCEGGVTVNNPRDRDAYGQLQFLEVLVEENASIAGDVIQVTEHMWAIHGYIPVDGDVLMAEFDTYDQATNVLGQLHPRSRRPEDR